MVSTRSYLSSASARQVVESCPPEKRTRAVRCMSGTLEEALQQLARSTIQRLHVRNAELHPVRAGDQQLAAFEATDVLLGLEHEAAIAAIGAHAPGAGHAETRHAMQFEKR